jgi:hypothetical protein
MARPGDSGFSSGRASRERAPELRIRASRAQTEALASEAMTRTLLDDAAAAVRRSEELLEEVRQGRERTAREVADILERLGARPAGRRRGVDADPGDQADDQGGRGGGG